MLRRIVLEPGQRLTEKDLARSGGVDAEIIGVAAKIVDDVRARGDVAIRELHGTVRQVRARATSG